MVAHGLLTVKGGKSKQFSVLMPEILLNCLPDLKFKNHHLVQPMETSFCYVTDDKALVDAVYWIGHCL